jgi:hypothetical protein
MHILDLCNKAGGHSLLLAISQRDENDQPATPYLVSEVMEILHRHETNLDVSVNASYLNPVMVTFDEYVLAHQQENPRLVGSWGNHLQALKDLCSIPEVKVHASFSGAENGYELNCLGEVMDTFESEPG